MYRLWIKIFVWFWVAMVAVGAALVAVVTVTQPDWPAGLGPRPGLTQNWRGLARSAFAEQARRTVRILNQQGEAALRPELERQREEFGILSVVFDRRGNEVSGLPEPAGARQLARQAQRSGRPEIRGERGGGLLVAIPVRSGYTVVGEMPRPYGFGVSPLGFLLRAATVLLTGGLVCYLLSRHLTSPLASLQGAARRLADGDLDTRASAGTLARRGDEFGDLARDFDRMAVRIQSLVERQQRLLGDISHELRSPLARLGVALELARERAGEEARGALDRIDSEVVILDRLIGDLLQLSRLEREERLSGEEVALDELLSEIVEDASFEGSVSGRRVVFRPGVNGRVSGSRRLLHSSFENVIRNGLAFTPEGGTVEVVLEGAGEAELRVLVRDGGKGVNPQLLEQIFEPFFRTDESRDVRRGGVGLGLAISRRIVQLHSGRMAARNRPEGGLEVEIVLPRSRPPDD